MTCPSKPPTRAGRGAQLGRCGTLPGASAAGCNFVKLCPRGVGAFAAYAVDREQSLLVMRATR
jgi:hypothetical protein